MFLAIALDWTQIAVLLTDENGQSLLGLKSPVAPNQNGEQIWHSAQQLARETMLRANALPAKIVALGLSLPPTFAPNQTRFTSPNAVWTPENWAARTAPELEINRAVAATRLDCAALAETKWGVLQNQTDWLMLGLEDHIEATAHVGGAALSGANGAAMQLGAMIVERDGVLGFSGKRGTLDAYCGARSWEEQTRSYGLTFRDALEVWQMSDDNWTAKSRCDDYVSRLAQGISAALAIINPSVVVVGGALCVNLGETLLVPLRTKVREMSAPEHTRALQVLAPTCGSDGAVLGAIALAMNTKLTDKIAPSD